MKRYELLSGYTFNELGEEVQKTLKDRAIEGIVTWLSGSDADEVARIFGENIGDIFRDALTTSERLRTPWFFREILYEQEEIRELVDQEASSFLNGVLFDASGNIIVDKMYVREVVQ